MKKYHVITSIFIAFCVMLCLMTIFVFKIKDMTIAKGEVYDYNEGWTIVRPDGSSEKIDKLPYSEASQANEIFSIENTIPDEYRGLTMSFLSADKELSVSVDGEVIYEFGKEDERLFGHTPGSITNFIDIPEDFKEGKIKIEAVSPYDGYASNFLNITVGEKDVIELMLIKTNLVNYLFCMIILFSAIMLIIFDVIDLFSNQHVRGTTYLGIISFLGAIYHAIETKTLNVFYGNQTLYSVIVFLVIMIMPALLCMYYLCSYDQKFLKRIKVNLILCYVNIVLQCCIQIFGIADFMITAPLSHVIIAATVINLVSITVKVIVEKYKESGHIEGKLILEGIGVSSITIGSLIDIIRFYISPVGDMGKYGRIGMLIFSVLELMIHVRSISSRYISQVEENMNLMTKLLEQAKAENKAKSLFLANMSHEIRTPMNSIMGFAEILLKQGLKGEKEEYVMSIRESSQNLLSIINDILDISKIESGRIELLKSDFSTKKLFGNIIMEMRLLAEKKGLEFKYDIDENLPRTLFGDEIRIREVLVNVINNAIKYTKEGSVAFVVTKNVDTAEKVNLNIKVIDTGIGIKKENQSLIFDAFVQDEQLKNKGIEGTGLGLSIVKSYINLMEGKISVDSEPGKGSTFEIIIPLSVVDEAPIGKIILDEVKEKKSNIGDIKIEGRTALIVDDSKVNLKLIRRILENYGLAVDEASGGQLSVEMCNNKNYDMIFMDQMMPEMDGVTAMKEIRKNSFYKAGGDCKIFALTANAIRGVEEELIQEGFDAYFRKPIEFKAIEETLVKYWGN